MKAIRALALASMGALATSCASTPDPVLCAEIGVVLGTAGGVAAGAEVRDESETAPIIGLGIAGAVVGGGAGYLLCKLLEEEEPPPPPKPEPAPPPPPPPPPEPEPPAVDPCAQVIRLRGVNFDFDRAEIRSDAAVILDEAASLLSDALAQCPSRRVSIEGHTDWTGPEAYNQGLSERRAGAVHDYLAGKGVPSGKLSTVGYGESQPISTNETRDGRALNRRVELRLVQ